MLGINETRFLVQHESSVNEHSMKLRVIWSKNGIMIKFGVSVKNSMIGVFVNMNIYEIIARMIVNLIIHMKLLNVYILKSVHVKKVLLEN